MMGQVELKNEGEESMI